jgi:IMP dehydrogenase
MIELPVPEALTFDDVLLVPAYSEVVPNQVGTQTRVTRNITLNIPLLSAAMDTVTESRLAIAMAQQGGIGVVHRNLSIEQQAAEIDKVKRSESGMIVDPVTIAPEQLISEALEVMRRYKISGVPVTKNKKLVGILTNRDLRFETRTDIPVGEVMTKDNLVTVAVGTTLQEAEQILHQHRIEKLLVVNDQYELKGLITVKDIQKKLKYPNAAKDTQGRLRVAAAIGATGDFLERAAEMIRNRVDALAIDSAHGHSSRVLDAIKLIKKNFPDIDLMAGNIATYDGAKALIDAGADAIKVGIGPGSICTTRMVTGAGMPQITAISEAYRAAGPRNVPVIADGGVKYSGDHSVSGTLLQNLSRHGFHLRHVSGFRRALLPKLARSGRTRGGHGRFRCLSRRQRAKPAGKICTRRNRRPSAVSRTAGSHGLSVGRRPALWHGIPRLQQH